MRTPANIQERCSKEAAECDLIAQLSTDLNKQLKYQWRAEKLRTMLRKLAKKAQQAPSPK